MIFSLLLSFPNSQSSHGPGPPARPRSLSWEVSRHFFLLRQCCFSTYFQLFYPNTFLMEITKKTKTKSSTCIHENSPGDLTRLQRMTLSTCKRVLCSVVPRGGLRQPVLRFTREEPGRVVRGYSYPLFPLKKSFIWPRGKPVRPNSHLARTDTGSSIQCLCLQFTVAWSVLSL